MFGLFENRVSKLAQFVALQSLFLAVLFLLKTYNYNLFHIIAEGYSITVALCIFFIVVNSQEYKSNNFISLLTSGFVATVAIDALHTLAFRGMNIFDGYDANLPTQLWILARYTSSITLLIAVLLFEKKVRLPVSDRSTGAYRDRQKFRAKPEYGCSLGRQAPQIQFQSWEALR